MSGWGGKRTGAGRPKGTFKAESNQRAHRQLRAFDDEWDIIQRLARIVKYGDREACEKFLARMEKTE